MKTVEYSLKSNPEKTVTIPEALLDGANKLFTEAIISTNADDLAERVQKYDKLKNYPIFPEALRLNYCLNKITGPTPELLRRRDTLYLKYCLYSMYGLVEKSNIVEHNEEEHNGLLNMMIPIMNTLRSLEAVDGGKE